MICPQCGYDMGNKSKCIRCGYEVKTLTVVTENDEKKQEQKQEKDETIVIDPCNVYLTHPYGYDDEYGTGYGSPFDDPFVSIIDSLFGDPIGDLFGGLFGFDMSPPRRPRREDPPPARRKKQGPIVVVDDIEIIEPEKEDKKTEKPHPQHQSEHKNPSGSAHKKPNGKFKNMFKKNDHRK